MLFQQSYEISSRTDLSNSSSRIQLNPFRSVFIMKAALLLKKYRSVVASVWSKRLQSAAKNRLLRLSSWFDSVRISLKLEIAVFVVNREMLTMFHSPPTKLIGTELLYFFSTNAHFSTDSSFSYLMPICFFSISQILIQLMALIRHEVFGRM